MWHEYWLTGTNGTIQPYGLIYQNNTKFVHIGKSVATIKVLIKVSIKVSIKVYFETNNIV